MAAADERGRAVVIVCLVGRAAEAAVVGRTAEAETAEGRLKFDRRVT